MEEEVQKTTEVTSTKRESIKPDPAQKAFDKKKTIFRTYQIIWYVLGVIEVLLAFRVVLKLIGANSTQGFTSFIYALSEPFAGPFLGVVAPVIAGVSVMEWSTVIAMVVYLIIAFGLVKLFRFMRPVTRTEVEQAVDSV